MIEKSDCNLLKVRLEFLIIEGCCPSESKDNWCAESTTVFSYFLAFLLTFTVLYEPFHHSTLLHRSIITFYLFFEGIQCDRSNRQLSIRLVL